MLIEFGVVKNLANYRKHGFYLYEVEDFAWEAAVFIEDERYEYGERRYRAIAPLRNELCTVVFTERDTALRIISVRASSRKERRLYDEG